MTIEMQPVESSQIHSRGYDPQTQTLAIRFKDKNGEPTSLYHYSPFPPEDFLAFQAAASVGSHFGKYIKPFPQKYPFVKVEESKQVAKPKAAEPKSMAGRAAPVAPAMVEFKPEEFYGVVVRADNLVEQAGRMAVATEEDFAKGGDLVRLLRAQKAVFEDARTQRVKPHNDYVRELNGWFKPYTEKLATADEVAVAKMDAWRRAENRRRQEVADAARRVQEQEALERAAALEAGAQSVEASGGNAEVVADLRGQADAVIQKAVETPAPKVEVSKVRGSFGSVAGAKKVWRVKVLNLRLLNDACVNAIMANDRAVDAIRIALKPLTDAAIAAGIADQVPGLSIKQEDETNVR